MTQSRLLVLFLLPLPSESKRTGSIREVSFEKPSGSLSVGVLKPVNAHNVTSAFAGPPHLTSSHLPAELNSTKHIPNFPWEIPESLLSESESVIGPNLEQVKAFYASFADKTNKLKWNVFLDQVTLLVFGSSWPISQDAWDVWSGTGLDDKAKLQGKIIIMMTMVTLMMEIGKAYPEPAQIKDHFGKIADQVINGKPRLSKDAFKAALGHTLTTYVTEMAAVEKAGGWSKCVGDFSGLIFGQKAPKSSSRFLQVLLQVMVLEWSKPPPNPQNSEHAYNPFDIYNPFLDMS